MDLTKTAEFARKIDGWLTDNEIAILYRLAHEVRKEGVIVEIGSWKGKSTTVMGNAILHSGNKAKIYACDPHTGSKEYHESMGKVWTYDTFIKNISSAGISNLVTPIVKRSDDFAKDFNDKVDLIFIDGVHDYDSVLTDLGDWFPKLSENGYIAFHDTYAGGDPYKVLRKYLYPARDVDIIRRADSITYVRKVKRNSLYVYMVNMCTRLLKDCKHWSRMIFKQK